MDTNIQIREVQVSYQPIKGKLFQVRSADNAFEYLSRAYDEGTIGLCEEFMVLLLNRANRVMGCLRPSKFPRFRYSLFKLITHLLIPFATIPVGILFYYACTATLPDKDIHIIFRDLSSISAPFVMAIIIAPIYYIHC